MTNFKANQYEAVRVMQHTVQVRKCGSGLALVGSSCHQKCILVHTPLRRKRQNNLFKHLILFQIVFCLTESQFVPPDVRSNVQIRFLFAPLYNFYLGKSKLLKECTFKRPGLDAVMPEPDEILENSQP